MDLNEPLGLSPPPRRRWRRPGLMIGAGLVLASAGGLAYVLVRADPRGGRPYAVVSLPLASSPRTASSLDLTSTGALPDAPDSLAGSRRSPVDQASRDHLMAVAGPAAKGTSEPVSGDRGVMERGVMVYRGSGEERTSAPRGPLVIDVSRTLDDPLGKGRAVPPPGAKPVGPAAKPQPRIAIFVSGMGLDPNATRTATEIMPPAVSLAFLPYGDKVGAAVGAATAKGHEVLLQLPMRNAAGAPGPHALRPDAPAEAARDDLAWMMGRFKGYDGVVNLLGAPVTADSALMTIVLKTMNARHLFYLDDGTSKLSIATNLASDLGVDAIKTDLLLDATSDPAVVGANLDRLVQIAKQKGRAIGMASGLPEHLAAIARFAADLPGKGIVLVPISVLAHADAAGSGATAKR